MKNSKEKFGERVGIIADLVGGQAELSRRSGISTVSIGSYLKGESDPSRERLVAMASAANVSLFWLATGEGEMRPSEEESDLPIAGTIAMQSAPMGLDTKQRQIGYISLHYKEAWCLLSILNASYNHETACFLASNHT